MSDCDWAARKVVQPERQIEKKTEGTSNLFMIKMNWRSVMKKRQLETAQVVGYDPLTGGRSGSAERNRSKIIQIQGYRIKYSLDLPQRTLWTPISSRSTVRGSGIDTNSVEKAILSKRNPNKPAITFWIPMIKISRVVLMLFAVPFVLAAQIPAPENEAAEIGLSGRSLVIQYHQETILSVKLNIDATEFQYRVITERNGNAVNQTLLMSTNDWNRKIRLQGIVKTSEEGFPCETEPPARGPLVVRNASGMSRSLRNRAVYDRRFDWVISVDANPKVLIVPTAEETKGRSFLIDVEGFEIVLRFRPRYYQQHRGLKYFEPWNYKVWPSSVAGWISWFAFFNKVTEQDMMKTADVVAEVLKPYGFEYFQMDDGYQRKNGTPEFWLTPKETFPRGLKFLSEYITGKGLKPGIWTATNFHDSAYAFSHPDFFVRAADGKPAFGNWIRYVPDGSNPAVLETLVKPLYRGLKEQGWQYFKVDALRHLRYEGYNANTAYFKSRGIDRVETFRRYAQTIRDEIGRETFMLGCWGIRPELVGIIDGCRIGDDGFSYAGLSQYNSFNNVVWRNDPDHIELNEDAYRSTMVTSLTGALMMLTDKPAVYRTPVVAAARKTSPVLFTLPGQLYDVDPSRSSRLGQVDSEVSGSGPRVFDAGYTPNCFLFLLELNRPFESWQVLGRTGGDFPEIPFVDLGLDPDKEYLVFEYWSDSFMGFFKKAFKSGAIDERYRSQAFIIRERRSRPQLVSSNRHISSGGVDLIDVQWNEPALVGSSTVVENDPYTLTFTEPAGMDLVSFECSETTQAVMRKETNVAFVSVVAKRSGTIHWKANYKLSEAK